MTINKKIFLLFSTLFIVLLSLIYFILKHRESSALEFENKVIKNKVNNLHNILMNKKKLLNNISYEYSTNETIIKLINQKNKANDFYDFSSKLDVSYFLVLNNQKQIVYSEAYDVSSKEYVDISDSINEFFLESDLSKYINNKKLQFMTFDYERLIFSLERIDEIGYVFAARTLDSTFLSESSSMLDSYISFLPSYKFKNKDILHDKFNYDITRLDSNTIYVNMEINDELEKESFFLSIKLNREFFIEIIQSNKNLLKLFFMSFLIFNLIIYVFISKIFTKRIGLISNTVKSVSKKKDLVQNIDLIYDDEITYLSSKMNEMFKIIREAQNEHIKKERDFLQSVLDSQQHIIFITDGTEIQSANKKFLDLFKTNNGFMNNIAVLDDTTKANLLKIAKKHSSIDKPARLKLHNNEDKYFVFDISRVEIRKYIICMNDVSKYNERITHLQNKASIDELTNCYNKATITEYCRYWIEMKDFGLIILDIDKFKNINDTYGHFIGDCILKDLAKLVSHGLHKDDLIGRFGGEEFIIAINASKDDLEAIANRIRILIEDYLFKYEDLELKITASLGCTYCQSGFEFEELFKIADDALYVAKKTGRNKVVYK